MRHRRLFFPLSTSEEAAQRIETADIVVTSKVCFNRELIEHSQSVKVICVTAFKELLSGADVISLHCPLNEKTQNLIDEQAFILMKPNALLINTARGGIVNEAALLQALTQGKIAGAGVDVLSQEPPRQGNSLLGVDLPNLIVTPHIAWASQQAQQRLSTCRRFQLPNLG